jgi:hypothetical protein
MRLVGPVSSALATILDAATRGNPSIAPTPTGNLLSWSRLPTETYVSES